MIPLVDRLIDLAIAEDIGSGDITTDSLVAPDLDGRAVVLAKEPLVLAGLQTARQVFTRFDNHIVFETAQKDGDEIQAGEIFIKLAGRLAALLKAERIGVKPAIDRARQDISHLVKIEVEVSTLEEAKQALAAKADVIMLDNMNLKEIRQAVDLIDQNALVEVSGNVTMDRLKALAETGVDLISIGALTHAARAVDISMRITT